MSSWPSSVAAYATATSAPDPTVWFHGSRGDTFLSLLDVWHRGKLSVLEIVVHIQVKIPTPGGIAEGVQVPTLRTSAALAPSTGHGSQKRAKPRVATNLESPKSLNVPIGALDPRDAAGVAGLVRGEMYSHPQRELRGPQLPFPGMGSIIGAGNPAIIEPSTRVIERTNAAPWRAADSHTTVSSMGPIVVDSDTPPSRGGLPEPQVRKNLFAAGPISPIVDQLDAESLTPDPICHLGPAR